MANGSSDSGPTAARQPGKSSSGPVVFPRLYGVTYVYLRPAGLPSVPVQLLTFVFYAMALAGITLHRRREPLPVRASRVEDRELRLVKTLFALMLFLAFVLSTSALRPLVFVPIVVNFIVWTILGALLTWVAFHDGVWERLAPAGDIS